jgi:hypothetical protein
MFLASKSSLTVSPYQLIFSENLPFKLLLRRLNNSVCVRSFFRRADKIAFLSVSYFILSIFFPLLPSGCFVSNFLGRRFPSRLVIHLFCTELYVAEPLSMGLGGFDQFGISPG